MSYLSIIHLYKNTFKLENKTHSVLDRNKMICLKWLLTELSVITFSDSVYQKPQSYKSFQRIGELKDIDTLVQVQWIENPRVKETHIFILPFSQMEFYKHTSSVHKYKYFENLVTDLLVFEPNL